jgi:hypothetical protein
VSLILPMLLALEIGRKATPGLKPADAPGPA